MGSLDENLKHVGLITNSFWLGIFVLTLLFCYPKVRKNFNILGKWTVSIYFCLTTLRTLNFLIDQVVVDTSIADLIMNILSTILSNTSWAAMYFFLF
jgi:hypothetical protein